MTRLIKENWLGVIGLIALCIAIPLTNGAVKNVLNVAGFLVLIAYAYLGKSPLFFYLEIVVLIGCIANILQLANAIKFPLVIVFAAGALIRVLSFADLRKWYTAFGIFGLVGLVYGYLTYSNLGYAIGGIGMVIYSAIEFYRGAKVALIFGILNLIYTGVAIYMLV